MSNFSLFGISLDTRPALAILADVARRLVESSKPSTWILTANPEILLRARKDAAYRSLVEKTDMRVVDGFGVVLLARLFQQKLSRVTGGDMLEVLVEKAKDEHLKIFFALSEYGLTSAQTLKNVLQTKYPDLSSQASSGTPTSLQKIPDDVSIVICTFGSPSQDEWIAEMKQKFPSVRVWIGVGGAVDVLCGTVRKAPAVFRQLGLEWLWRLMVQPRRYPRIFRAVFVFPFIAFFDLLRQKSNV